MYFTKADAQVSNKHVKRLSASLVMNGTQMEIQMRYRYTPSRKLKLKGRCQPPAEMRARKTLARCGWDCDWHRRCGKRLSVSFPNRTRLRSMSVLTEMHILFHRQTRASTFQAAFLILAHNGKDTNGQKR